MSHHLLQIAVLAGLMMAAQSQITLEPKYTFQPGSLTVSGISAGGAMATQFHVAYSKNVNGVGIFAGIPYGCAKGSLSGATNCMYSPMLTSVPTLITRTDGYAKSGTIDPTVNMKDDKVYVFHGTKDSTVNPKNGEQIVTYYENYLANNNQIATEFKLAAVHCQPTDNFGSACGIVNSQYYINDCDYQGAFVMLNHVYDGSMKPGVPAVQENFKKFSQKEFFNNNPSTNSMDDIGYIYTPTECENDPTRICKLHIAFHGCQQYTDKIGDVYAKNAGYLEVAERNAIVVLFPNAQATVLSNPNGCFDWWGYDDKDYETQKGNQMDGIYKMIKKLGYPLD